MKELFNRVLIQSTCAENMFLSFPIGTSIYRWSLLRSRRPSELFLFLTLRYIGCISLDRVLIGLGNARKPTLLLLIQVTELGGSWQPDIHLAPPILLFHSLLLIVFILLLVYWWIGDNDSVLYCWHVAFSLLGGVLRGLLLVALPWVLAQLFEDQSIWAVIPVLVARFFVTAVFSFDWLGFCWGRESCFRKTVKTSFFLKRKILIFITILIILDFFIFYSWSTFFIRILNNIPSF